MSYYKLRIANPKLFFDGVNKGLVPTSALPDVLQVGSPVSSAMVEGFLGGPYAPESYTFDPYVGVPFGGSGAYPKPWRSAAQKLQDDVYTASIGPFAKMVGVTDCSQNSSAGCSNDTCAESQLPSATAPEIYGRLGLILTGGFSGQVGFNPQDWYNQDQGSYDHDYWSDQFELTGDGRWLSKKDWWESATKTVISVWYGSIKVDVEVATGSVSFADTEYFKGLDLATYNDFSLDILFVMVSVAAATRWIF